MGWSGMHQKHFIVILNLFQDDGPRLLVILKQVQDDEGLCKTLEYRAGTARVPRQ
jgi:hypothetical protein